MCNPTIVLIFFLLHSENSLSKIAQKQRFNNIANMGCGASAPPAPVELTAEEKAAALAAADKEADGIKFKAIQAMLKDSAQWAAQTGGTAGAFKKGGFFDKNNNVNIKKHMVSKFPETIDTIETVLRAVPFGAFTSECDEFVALLGEGAEASAKACEPIFVASIDAMTSVPRDLFYEGKPEAASMYLEAQCAKEISEKCLPAVSKALESSKCCGAWEVIRLAFEKMPGVDPLEFDMNAWVCQQACSGLWALVQAREAAIRVNPGDPSMKDPIIKDVFGNKALLQERDSFKFNDAYKAGKSK